MPPSIRTLMLPKETGTQLCWIFFFLCQSPPAHGYRWHNWILHMLMIIILWEQVLNVTLETLESWTKWDALHWKETTMLMKPFEECCIAYFREWAIRLRVWRASGHLKRYHQELKCLSNDISTFSKIKIRHKSGKALNVKLGKRHNKSPDVTAVLYDY